MPRPGGCHCSISVFVAAWRGLARSVRKGAPCPTSTALAAAWSTSPWRTGPVSTAAPAAASRCPRPASAITAPASASRAADRPGESPPPRTRGDAALTSLPEPGAERRAAQAAARKVPTQHVMAPRPLQFERRELAGLTWFILVAGIPRVRASPGLPGGMPRARRTTRSSRRRAEDLSERLAASVRRHDQVLLSTAGPVRRFARGHPRGVLELLRRAGAERRACPKRAASSGYRAARRRLGWCTRPTASGWAAPGAAAGLRGRHRAGAEAGARRQPGRAHQDRATRGPARPRTS